MIGVCIKSYCIQHIHTEKIHIHIFSSSKPNSTFLPVPYFLLHPSAQMEISHILALSSPSSSPDEDDLFPRESEPLEPLCTQ